MKKMIICIGILVFLLSTSVYSLSEKKLSDGTRIVADSADDLRYFNDTIKKTFNSKDIYPYMRFDSRINDIDFNEIHYNYSYMYITDRGKDVKDIFIVVAGYEWYITLYASSLPTDKYGKSLKRASSYTADDLSQAFLMYNFINPFGDRFFLTYKQ